MQLCSCIARLYRTRKTDVKLARARYLSVCKISNDRKAYIGPAEQSLSKLARVCLIMGDVVQGNAESKEAIRVFYQKGSCYRLLELRPIPKCHKRGSRTIGRLSILPTITIQVAANARLYKMLSKVVAHR